MLNPTAVDGSTTAAKKEERRRAGRGQGPAIAAVRTSGGQRVGDRAGTDGAVEEVVVQAQPRQGPLE
jgi:hypothetical protein